jgi:hypothetical protein
MEPPRRGSGGEVASGGGSSGIEPPRHGSGGGSGGMEPPRRGSGTLFSPSLLSVVAVEGRLPTHRSPGWRRQATRWRTGLAAACLTLFSPSLLSVAVVEGEIRRLEARSTPVVAGSALVVAGSSKQRADPASGRPPPVTAVRIQRAAVWRVDWLGGPVGGLAGLIHGLFFFCFLFD